MSSAERFQAIAQAIAALPSEAERSAAAVELFGGAGAQLLPLFAGGAQGIAQAVEQADRLGLALTDAQGKDVSAMNNAFTLAGKSIEGIIGQVTAYLAPAITAIADTFISFVGSMGGANIGQAIGDGIIAGARFLAGIGDWLITNLSGVWQYVSEVGVRWASVVDFLNRVSSIVAGVFSAAQALFLGIIGALTTTALGLAQIAQQIGKFLRFDTSSLDSFIATSSAFKDSIDESIVGAGKSSIAAFQNAFAETAQPIGQAIAGPLTTALDAAVAKAKASAASVSQAGAGAAGQAAAVAATAAATAAVAATVERQALKGIDSRSSEGVAEMFRLMRGTGGSVPEAQLAELKKIRERIEAQEQALTFAIQGG